MPSLELKTNVPLADPKSFLLEFSSYASKTLGKPELYISVSYHFNENLTFNGSFEPAFLMTVTSLDNLQPERNVVYSKAFFDFFESKLGIQNDRGYITFLDPGRTHLGHKATTFKAIFG
ncbi:Tautomerase/MIF [Laetiporus sulphureus 93-53]|uniref:L-dopachrome isomerase n=1 Tax=Laetiporus sulphureus 93-53 TaxID=1314785 RepID=A0A165HEU1_9APHY|nr:Tautomerase/MIF [Laetiporus sulphureus 93-53]KZT11644.1 Tautomerase/MIF [Laetiporus sulphureus 93-53]